MVQLEKHDPTWRDHFRELRRRISKAANVQPSQILHIGSTSVPVLQAKPILDIDVVLLDSDDIEHVVAQLTRLGFLDRGQKDGGIGRLLVFETAPEIRSIHVHLLEFTTDHWRRDLAFRDTLRSDTILRERYGVLKAQLAQEFATDREAYRHAKNAFIVETLQRLGLHGDESIRRLQPHEVDLYRDIRTQALETDPDAFGETLDAFSQRDVRALRAWFEQRVARSEQGILIKAVDGRARAMCGYGIADDDPSVGYLWGMFVSPSIRGGGVGKQLVREATRLLAVLGAERVRAKVAAPNEVAIRFYEAVGFTVGEPVGKLREGSAVPVYGMELAIDSLLR